MYKTEKNKLDKNGILDFIQRTSIVYQPTRKNQIRQIVEDEN